MSGEPQSLEATIHDFARQKRRKVLDPHLWTTRTQLFELLIAMKAGVVSIEEAQVGIDLQMEAKTYFGMEWAAQNPLEVPKYSDKWRDKMGRVLAEWNKPIGL